MVAQRISVSIREDQLKWLQENKSVRVSAEFQKCLDEVISGKREIVKTRKS